MARSQTAQPTQGAEMLSLPRASRPHDCMVYRQGGRLCRLPLNVPHQSASVFGRADRRSPSATARTEVRWRPAVRLLFCLGTSPGHATVAVPDNTTAPSGHIRGSARRARLVDGGRTSLANPHEPSTPAWITPVVAAGERRPRLVDRVAAASHSLSFGRLSEPRSDRKRNDA